MTSPLILWFLWAKKQLIIQAVTKVGYLASVGKS
jgi:hypothetical protein